MRKSAKGGNFKIVTIGLQLNFQTFDSNTSAESIARFAAAAVDRLFQTFFNFFFENQNIDSPVTQYCNKKNHVFSKPDLVLKSYPKISS